MASVTKAISSLVKIGYNEELAKQALKTNGNNIEKTINFLEKLRRYGCDISDTLTEDDGEESDEESGEESDNDPLGFLKTSRRLAVLKNIVYQDIPEEINNAINSAMVAFSIGDWEEITNNQEDFLNLLNNNDEIKQLESMELKNIFDAKDQEKIQMIIDLGFPDYLAEQAFYACEKNVNAAIKLLKDKAK